MRLQNRAISRGTPRHVRPSRHLRRWGRAYSLIEMLITVLIIQIISGMVMVNVSQVQTNERLARACEQIVLALRYARLQAMSTGQPGGVEFNVATNSVRV